MNLFGWGKKRPPAPDPSPDQAQAAAPQSGPAAEPTALDAAPGPQEPEAAAKAGLFSRLFEGLKKSSGKLAESVAAVFTKKKLDQETLDALEEALIGADLGAGPAARIVQKLKKDRFDKEIAPDEIRLALADEIAEVLAPSARALDWDAGPRPLTILMVGVNGSGKTTTIGKMAHNLSLNGRKVLIAAGDTFRAAAIDQLRVWADRAGALLVAKQTGADAAALAYEALTQAREQDCDVLLIDTAGRLQNKTELMAELEKIVRVLKKIDPAAPHHVLLVLDATVGQNALSQADAFVHSAGVSGLVMTKLDGTAKGGVLVALADRHKLPIHFIGVGESAEDLQAFDALAFARALVGVRA